MGLISRVSSRTYRRKFPLKNFHKKTSKTKKWLNKTLPSLPSPEGPEEPTFPLLLTSEEMSCPPLSPKNSEANTTSGPCPSAKTTKSNRPRQVQRRTNWQDHHLL